jgi:hypothetical protein
MSGLNDQTHRDVWARVSDPDRSPLAAVRRAIAESS